MKIIMTGLILIFFTTIILTSCTFTLPILIPKTIPVEMQQLIKSTKVESVDYTFTPNEKANLITFRQTMGAAITYQELKLNDAIEPLLNELIQTKFSKISKESAWKVNVIVQDVFFDTEEQNNFLLFIKTIISNGNKQSEKYLDYPISIGWGSDKSSLIHSYLLKFIIGIDKFIDNEFDVQ